MTVHAQHSKKHSTCSFLTLSHRLSRQKYQRQFNVTFCEGFKQDLLFFSHRWLGSCLNVWQVHYSHRVECPVRKQTSHLLFHIMLSDCYSMLKLVLQAIHIFCACIEVHGHKGYPSPSLMCKRLNACTGSTYVWRARLCSYISHSSVFRVYLTQ